MTPLRTMPILLAIIIAVLVSGCARKKPVLLMPQQQPPAAAPTPTPSPEAQTQVPPQPTPQPSVSPEIAKSNGEKESTGSTTVRRRPIKKPSPQHPAEKGGTETAHNTKPKVTVDNGNTPAQPVPPAPSPEITHEQASTEQLLQSTETAINGIKRQLSQDEQTMLAQIRDFIQQSRKASSENDLTRAHNLALKAHLLSDELARQR